MVYVISQPTLLIQKESLQDPKVRRSVEWYTIQKTNNSKMQVNQQFFERKIT